MFDRDCQEGNDAENEILTALAQPPPSVVPIAAEPSPLKICQSSVRLVSLALRNDAALARMRLSSEEFECRVQNNKRCRRGRGWNSDF